MKRCILAVVVGLGLLAPAAAQGRDVVVNSFDDTPIVAHFYPAAGLKKGEKAPTILIGHGWGGTGEAETGSPAPFIAAGYNVLTWDARGFGGSGGTVQIDDPRFEGRDVSALIDFVAKQREAKLDEKGKHGKPGDPRLGMSGASYGGGIQLLAAARDHRIDAITPTIAWHDLPSSLYPSTSVKAGWDLALIGVGIPTSVALGIFSPAGVQTGNQSEQFYDSVTQGLATGIIPDSDLDWFAEHGPDRLLHKIKAPTLIAQGTVDTLFTLDQGHRNYMALKHETDVPLKMMWFCGGHGICNVDGDGSAVIGDSDKVQKRRLQWFDRYLKAHRKQHTGPAFEWIDQNGKWHQSGAYPLRSAGALKGSAASGIVPLVPGENPTSGVLVLAEPDPAAPVKVPIHAKGGEDLVGPPTVSFSYSALGTTTTRDDGATHVYAQIVDKDRNVVAGNQATPIKIKLDGDEHQVSQKLVRIAQDAPAAGYELQIIGQSSLYDAQRAAGAVQLSDVKVSLPVTKPRPKH